MFLSFVGRGFRDTGPSFTVQKTKGWADKKGEKVTTMR